MPISIQNGEGFGNIYGEAVTDKPFLCIVKFRVNDGYKMLIAIMR